MVINAVIRQSDGLVGDVQITPRLPADQGAALIQNAVAKFGGVAGDWRPLEIPAAVYGQIAYDGASRQFATVNSWQELVDDELETFYEVTALSQSTPPAMSQDKAQILNDGADSVTFTADVGDASFVGQVTWAVTAPDGSTQTTSENAAAGVSTLEFLTNDAEGTYHAAAETELHGVGKASVAVV